MNVTVSDNFKRETGKSVVAIIVFMLIYFILLTFSIFLSLLFIILGIALIFNLPGIYTIIIGIGLASMGIIIFIFLFKFLFKKHKISREHLIEVSKDREPRFFAFLDEMVKEVNTNSPKKVYLSSDVNASVFYDSFFWSMFLPVKKNLQIGMGLINTVTEQELKAILSHEFGHFSQRSMKVGSYVYNVNRVIYNMLYDNESFDEMTRKWANFTSYFFIFVSVAKGIIKIIQWVLRKMYGFVNVSYMALSREMEFHADAIAANVAGYQPLKDALLRMDLSSQSLDTVLNYYGNTISNNIKSKNIFKDQLFVMDFYGKENSLQVRNGLPQVSQADINRYNKFRLNFEDQWASHPATADRIAAIEKLNSSKEDVRNEKAILLFSDPDSIQEQVTTKIFSNVQFTDEPVDLDFESFCSDFVESFNKGSFPKEYRGYYDNKNPEYFNIDEILEPDHTKSMELLFSDEMIDLIYEFNSLENDKNTLEYIYANEKDIKTFDFEGIKYKANKAKSVIDEIESKVSSIRNAIIENDIEIYRFFTKKSLDRGGKNELDGLYKEFFENDQTYNARIVLYNNFMSGTEFINITTPYERIEFNFREISDLEALIKKEIRGFLSKSYLIENISDNMKNNFDMYLSKELVYFKDGAYNNDNLQIMFASVNDYNYLISRSYFLSKMNLLKFQIGLLEK